MRLSIISVLIILSISLFAQESGQLRISGKVTDQETGAPLPGTNILIKGTYKGTLSDLSGEYNIIVPGSEDILVFSFIGYIPQEITVGNQMVIDIILQPEATSLEEVVITAQAKGQIGARSQQINSNTLKNVVAPDRLQENPDANAVEAIGRLPGIAVLRGGGEGNSLVIRGLEPRYTSVTLNGVQMPSTGGSGRGTNISGISQYALQGVEVFKALTPDMEANSVAGTVNLKLRETPEGFHYNLMAQGGYNDLNSYFGNYKLQAEVSNRFLDNKLGAFLTVNAESVNRSTQTMSAGYGLESTEADILINSANLNYILTTKFRRSAMLSLDYKLHSTTTLSLYGLYTYSKDDHERQTKNYGTSGIGNVGYNFHDNPFRNSEIIQSALSGVTRPNFLNMEIDYGVAYSMSTTDDPQSRSWNYGYVKVPSTTTFSNEVQQLDPSEIIPLFTDNGDSLQDLQLNYLHVFEGELSDKNLTTYLNFKVPYNIGNNINGYFKFGGTYRVKERFQDNTSGTQTLANNQFGKKILADSLDWVVRVGLAEDVTAVGMKDYEVDEFLKGKYNYGWYYNFDRMNEITDMWSEVSEYYYSQGSAVWLPIFGEKSKVGYSQNISGSMMDDQDITENYLAGYAMTELNIGRWVMLLPGIRYETTEGTMQGFKSVQPTLPDPIYAPLPGDSTSAERSDEFLLPMLHLRIKPIKGFYTHLAYTQSISRPDFNSISPNIFINTGFAPFTYTSTNPALKAESWENYDAQLTWHGNKIGLISLSGFYKTVEDKIWYRSYKRLKGDPIIEPFPDASLVNVSTWENHQYPIYVRGLEFEVQTSFWYLPKPFNYFTAYANYTYTESETQYPQSNVVNIVPPGGGRPVATRIDTTVTGPMLYQPKHIANASLGFNRKGLNIWLSFQYNGLIYTSKNFQLDELDALKENFYRVDLQITQKLTKKLKGLELMANFANLSDYTEVSRLRGDPRPTYLENYGWTLDLGARYRF